MNGVRLKQIFLVVVIVILTHAGMAADTGGTDPSEWGSFPMMWMAAMVLGVSALIGLFLLIYLLARQHHTRVMAMVAKGIYQPRPINWPLILSAAGCLLIFLAPAITLLFLSEDDFLYGISLGLFLILGGIALLVIRILVKKQIAGNTNG